MLSQDNIDPNTPMGATLVAGGATFRVWAPRAVEVYINGTFGGVPQWDQSHDQLMARDSNGYWSGFVAGASDADPYKFYVVGTGSFGYKRDPYARELADDVPFPYCNCVLRDSTSYPWHDAAFETPDFSNMIVYQLHIGTYTAASTGGPCTFLDAVAKLEYLVALGINVIQPLPIDEFETTQSLGYNGSDYFSPDLPYVVPASALGPYLETVNRLRANKGAPQLSQAHLSSGPNQLKAMIDLCHLYGIAVVFDVVYNHAGGFEGDDQALYFWDRVPNGDNNNSLYFTAQGWAGGLSFAFWNRDARQFIINSARYYIDEFHVDGFRYDEVSALVNLNAGTGWSFCQDITSTLRFIKPRLIQNAEFWPVNAAVVAARGEGGAGFDVLQHDGLRDSVRAAIGQCSFGVSAPVNLDAIGQQIYPPSFGQAWQAVTCVENHDIVKQGVGPRIPALADGSNHRSWYARSRSRVATTLLLTAPGIPMLFMGQEFLEDKQWSDDPHGPDLLHWQGLESGDKSMVDHLRFTQDAIQLRWRQPALRGTAVRVFHVHNDNRVIAFHRWIEGVGQDVVVVVSLNDATFYGYGIGFPWPGPWQEVFNSDVYDNWVNPQVAGNGGAIVADGGPMHGFDASCAIVIPANGVVVFAHGPQ
jgi:1,4-alpha-glucan branching enzyme